MNLKCCTKCASRMICKYFDLGDPRMIEGFCIRFTAEGTNTKQQDTIMNSITQPKVQEQPKKEVNLFSIDEPVHLHETYYKVTFGTKGPYKNKNYLVTTFYTTVRNIDNTRKELGKTIFKTKAAATEAAEIALYCKPADEDK